MNKQARPEQISKFKFWADRVQAEDPEFHELVSNCNFQAIDPTTIGIMFAKMYNNTDIEWVKEKMRENQNTFALPSKQELAPFYEWEL